LGSAVYAFEQTCPDRLDLLHRHFRLLCRALADIDEWFNLIQFLFIFKYLRGQIVMIDLLTRYARTQFLSPFGNGRKWSLDESKGAEKEENDHHYPLQPPLDPDHNLLLSSVRPLLQSRNPAVVMVCFQIYYFFFNAFYKAVAQLLYYIAPHSQLSVVPRALVRLLRGPNEVQYIILVNIASICVNTARQQQDREVFAISKVKRNFFMKIINNF
jgi:AP-3 complex subunit beta